MVPVTAKNWSIPIRGEPLTLWVEEDAQGHPVKVEARVGKLGSPFGMWVSMVCDALTINLRRGVPVAACAHGLRRTAGDPGSEAIDAIARVLEQNYPEAS